MVNATVVERIKLDKYATMVLKHILAKGDKGAYLNQLSREMSDITRVTILSRLVNLEDNGVLTSQMERMEYGEEKVQKWTRNYRISGEYLTCLEEMLK